MDKLRYEPPHAPRFVALAPLDALRPTSAEAVVACVTEARREGLTLHVGGGCRHGRDLPAPPSTVLDTRALSRIVSWDPRALVVHVEAGLSLRKLTDYLSRRGASLATWRREHPTATIGGLLSSYQPVPRGLWNGSIREVCLGLRCVTATAEEYGYVPAPRKAAGPDLRYLFIGAEGRFGVITEAWLGVAPAPEVAKFYALALPSSRGALAFMAACWATGLRVPNAIYSGGGRTMWLLLEGSRDFVGVMEGIVLDLCQRYSASLTPRDPEDYYDPAEGDVRAGADPTTGRAEDPQGAVALWGNLSELAALPAEVWEVAMLTDISPHQASAWLPASCCAGMEIFDGQDVGGGEVFWWDGGRAVSTEAGARAVATESIAAAMDPDGVFARGGER